jgi:hypothetical protein
MAENDDQDRMNGSEEVATSMKDEPAAEAGSAGDSGKINGSDAESDDDEPVGYGRPPKHSRFKPGQSGNRKGRPKSARGLRTLLREEMHERVAVTENGKTKKLSKLQIIIKRLVERAAKGDPKAVSSLIDLNIKVFGIEDDDNKAAPLTPEEQEILRNLGRERSGGDAESGLAGDWDLTRESGDAEGDESDAEGGNNG